MAVHFTDVEDLAIAVLGIPDDSDCDAIDMALDGQFEASFKSFQMIVEALIPFTITAKAAINGQEFHGFVKNGAFICKLPVTGRG